MNDYRAALIEVASRLGAESGAQEAYVQRPGVGVDELALELDDLLCLAQTKLSAHELDQRAYDALIALENLLDQMSGEDKAHLWTIDALRQTSEWAQVRRLANKAVEELRNERS